MWKHIAANTFTVLIALLIALAVFVAIAQNRYRATGPLETAICLPVLPGSKFYDVANELGEKGAISSPSLFRVGADYQGLIC